MKTKLFFFELQKFILFFFLYCLSTYSFGQCTFTSTAGYNVTVAVKPTAIVVNNCYANGNGFQYQIKYSYNVSFSSPPPVNEGLYTLQGVFNCGAVSINLPIAGGSGSVTSANNASYSGSSPTCAAAMPTNIGCTNISIHISGYGLPDQTVNCPYASNISILPVTFLNFTGIAETSGVQLNWSTASETNNSFFTIEKSKDSQSWAAIGKVNGVGNSTQINNYSFEDNSLNFTTAYYRIKQTDIDGNFSYSSIISVSQATNSKMGIFPNPNNGNTITINGVQSVAGWQLKLMNVASQVVFATTLKSNQLQLPQIPAGMYLIQLFNINTGASSVYKYLKN
jgi:hypothetical protein